jgi:hypothetical protein
MFHHTAMTMDHAAPTGMPSYSPRPMTGRVAWLPWTDPGPIATSQQERVFVAELAEVSGGAASTHARSDATALLNALRGGLSVRRLFAQAPGLRPERVHRAYEVLEERRAGSAAAWAAIVDEPTVGTLHALGGQAARLVPVLVHRLLDTADIDPDLLPEIATRLASGVEDVRRLVHRTELEMNRHADIEMAMAISRALYDPTSDCVFGRVEHLPERVGSLMPTRVAALLDEHVQGTTTFFPT